jgi:hypothetical protein
VLKYDFGIRIKQLRAYNSLLFTYLYPINFTNYSNLVKNKNTLHNLQVSQLTVLLMTLQNLRQISLLRSGGRSQCRVRLDGPTTVDAIEARPPAKPSLLFLPRFNPVNMHRFAVGQNFQIRIPLRSRHCMIKSYHLWRKLIFSWRNSNNKISL